MFFFFKQKTAYEMRISDWSSDVCSSDLADNCFVHDYSFPGRNSSITISSEKPTMGAHEGAATAMVMASLTPMMMPATSGPSAMPRPPSMTAAKTTPTQAKICEGLSVKVSARQMTAPAASAAPLRDSNRPNAQREGQGGGGQGK